MVASAKTEFFEPVNCLTKVNEDLSNIIEQALLYASPLPVTSDTSGTATSENDVGGTFCQTPVRVTSDENASVDLNTPVDIPIFQQNASDPSIVNVVTMDTITCQSTTQRTHRNNSIAPSKSVVNASLNVITDFEGRQPEPDSYNLSTSGFIRREECVLPQQQESRDLFPGMCESESNAGIENKDLDQMTGIERLVASANTKVVQKPFASFSATKLKIDLTNSIAIGFFDKSNQGISSWTSSDVTGRDPDHSHVLSPDIPEVVDSLLNNSTNVSHYTKSQPSNVIPTSGAKTKIKRKRNRESYTDPPTDTINSQVTKQHFNGHNDIAPSKSVVNASLNVITEFEGRQSELDSYNISTSGFISSESCVLPQQQEPRDSFPGLCESESNANFEDTGLDHMTGIQSFVTNDNTEVIQKPFALFSATKLQNDSSYSKAIGFSDINVNQTKGISSWTSSDATGSDPDHSHVLSQDIPEVVDSFFKKSTNISHSIKSQPSDDISTSGAKPKIKRKRNRVSNPDRPLPEKVLPPCRVCDVESSGFHYGANTCEACKGFFRRSLKKNEVSFTCKCSADEKLSWERGPYKNGCAACRYERCLKVGMSKNAIKIGRYTLNRKTDNIKEVKSLEAMDTLIEAAIVNATDTDSSGSLTDQSYLGLSSPEMTALMIGSPGQPEQPMKRLKPECDNNLSLKEIDIIVKTLVEAHNATMFHHDVEIDTVSLRQAEYLEKFRLRTELFGVLPVLSQEEYMEFYNATGIDVDGRKQHLEDAMGFFEKNISKLVKFSKAIPGFKHLTFSDQAKLVKASRSENVMVGHFRRFVKAINIDLQVLWTPWGTGVHFTEMGRLFPKDLFAKKISISQKLNDLDLSVHETAIFRALVIVHSDRCTLEEPEKVEKIRANILRCLEHLLNIRPGGRGALLYKIFDIMVSMRDLSEREHKFHQELCVDWPNMLDNNETVRNVFNIKD